MENKIEIFKNEEFGEIRVVEIEGEPWFVGKDVAEKLGYGNPRQGIASHVDDEDKGVQKLDTPSGTQNMTIINESGLYSLILSSKLSTAKAFKRWVTSEVLPTIRKTGSYIMKREEPTEVDKNNAMAALLNARVAIADRFIDLSKNGVMPKEFKNVLEIYAANTLAGETILALPPVDRKTYSATEVGEMLDVSANKIGRLANANNLKTEQYGKYFYDKAKHSNKEIETFRYYDNAVEIFRTLLA